MAEPLKFKIRVGWDNPKAFRALKSLVRNLESVEEDFEYRDDVKEAIRAARYLVKNMNACVIPSE